MGKVLRRSRQSRMILQLCSGGYRFYLTSCIDVDECLEGSDGCDAEREACVNTEGSFECVERRRDAEGGVVWVRCPRGYEQGRKESWRLLEDSIQGFQNQNS